MTLLRKAARLDVSASRGRSECRAALENEFRRRIDRTKKNAAEAALKIWRHPSMKESLLAGQSLTELT